MKSYKLLALLASVCLLSACGADTDDTDSAAAQQALTDQITGASDTSRDTTTAEPAPEVESEPETEIIYPDNTYVTPDIDLPTAEGVDIDLTQLSSTVVYGELYQILMNASAYLGMTLRMEGNFGIYTDPASGNVYYSVGVVDSTMCCVQGLEFLLAEEPEAYPAVDDIITVTGVLEIYEENGYFYIRLGDAVMG